MSVHELLERFPRAGRLEWIGLSPGRRAEIRVVDQARVEVGTGLEGDHHSTSGLGERQVTLIQGEHLPVVSSLCGREVRPELLRRNLVVTGINLAALKGRRFRVGEVVLEGAGNCDPCARLEENLGPGGLNAMRGHAGITARVLVAGTLRLGDAVVAEPASA